MASLPVPPTADVSKLSDLARDVLDHFRCICNDEERPDYCECGGDGPDGPEGCWRCQAHTALFGYGAPPKETTP